VTRADERCAELNTLNQKIRVNVKNSSEFPKARHRAAAFPAFRRFISKPDVQSVVGKSGSIN